MSAAGCLFCGIAGGQIGADRVFEDDSVVAIRDINPQAPVHLLVMPRAHIRSAAEVGVEEDAIWGRLHQVARSLAEQEGIDSAGYRLVVNTGRDGGQTVDHLHMHVIGGRAMTWPPG